MIADLARDRHSGHKFFETSLITKWAWMTHFNWYNAVEMIWMICEARLERLVQRSLDIPLGCSPLEPSLCSSPELYLLSDFPKAFNSPSFSSHTARPHVNIPCTSPAKDPAESQHQLTDMWVSKQVFRWVYHLVFEPPRWCCMEQRWDVAIDPCQNYRIFECFSHFTFGEAWWGEVRGRSRERGQREFYILVKPGGGGMACCAESLGEAPGFITS